jgi:hypothetical protein
MGSYGNTFKINLKTSGGTIATDQFTALFIDNTGNISCCSNLSTAGTIYANGDKLNFPNLLNQYKINLYGTNSYGFGIAGDILQYSSQNYHRFYNSSNNANTFTIDSTGNIISTGYLFAGGTTTGLRINGNDYGNTIYQDAATIGGQPANIGFSLRNTNTFNFFSSSTSGGHDGSMEKELPSRAEA